MYLLWAKTSWSKRMMLTWLQTLHNEIRFETPYVYSTYSQSFCVQDEPVDIEIAKKKPRPEWFLGWFSFFQRTRRKEWRCKFNETIQIRNRLIGWDNVQKALSQSSEYCTELGTCHDKSCTWTMVLLRGEPTQNSTLAEGNTARLEGERGSENETGHVTCVCEGSAGSFNGCFAQTPGSLRYGSPPRWLTWWHDATMNSLVDAASWPSPSNGGLLERPDISRPSESENWSNRKGWWSPKVTCP